MKLARNRLDTCAGRGGGNLDATPGFQVATRLHGSKSRAAGEADGPGERNPPPRRSRTHLRPAGPVTAPAGSRGRNGQQSPGALLT